MYCKPNYDTRDSLLLSVDTIRHQVARHVLRDGTHEIRAGLIGMVPAGLGLVWLLGVRGVGLGFWVIVASAVLVLAGPGVTALRTRFVLPRLGYARHTQTTDLATLIAMVVVIGALVLAWLEQGGNIPWGRPAAGVALTGGVLLLARESSLGRHYLVALLVAVVGAVLFVERLPPLPFLAALVLATALLLALGGAAALRSLVVHHPEVDDGAP